METLLFQTIIPCSCTIYVRNLDKAKETFQNILVFFGSWKYIPSVSTDDGTTQDRKL